MTMKELNKILKNHKHWLNEDCEGWENMRANLRYADLSGADLRYANLRYADLRYANLRYANLRYANLSGADLSGADLSDANLRYADLSGADLSDADLSDADLSDADLRYANLRYAKNIPFVPYSCPDFGMFVGYKKANGYIIELEIPEDAKRLSATTRKCRCNKAKVLRILNYDRTVADITEVASSRDNTFIYRIGEIVEVNDFNEDRWDECSAGIHFFINFQEAVNYNN